MYHMFNVSLGLHCNPQLQRPHRLLQRAICLELHGRMTISACADFAQAMQWLTLRCWGLAPVALRGHGGEVSVNTLCPASHVDGLP